MIDFKNIPPELKALPRWVCWKGPKIPYDPRLLNSPASSTDPTTWATFDEAKTAYLEREGDADAFRGLGFMLNADGIVGVDIDHCVTDGQPDPRALKLLNELGANYIEISPSGTGLHAFGYAEQLDRGCKGMVGGLAVELYSTARYLTMTGQTIKAGPLAPLRGFKALADSIRAGRKTVDMETGEILDAAPDERHGELVRRILSGDVFHDSLRDLAASLVATGMQPGAIVNHLRGLMDASAAPRDERWTARRKQIPDLVSSACAKFQPVDMPRLMEQAAANEPRYKLLTGDDLAALPPLRWCVRGVLPDAGLAVIFGPSGSGKSFLTLDMFAAVAEGRPWFDCRVEQRPVVYCVLEGEGGFRSRVLAWEQHHERKLPDAMRAVLQPFALTEQADVAALAAAILQAGFSNAVVVVDTLNRAAPGADENSGKDMSALIDAAKQLQSLVGGLVVLVHHSGKDATRGMRGHSSLHAALDAAVEVQREGERRFWTVAKSKDGADGDARPFKLDVLTIGQDEYGDDITSCVVSPPDPEEQRREKPLTPAQQLAIKTFHEAALDAGDDDGEFVHVTLEAWREAYYRASPADNHEAKRKAFQRARTDLVNMGRLTVKDDVYSLRVANDWGFCAAKMSRKMREETAEIEASGTPGHSGTLAGHVPDCTPV